MLLSLWYSVRSLLFSEGEKVWEQLSVDPCLYPLHLTQKSISLSWKSGGYFSPCVYSLENKNRCWLICLSYQYALSTDQPGPRPHCFNWVNRGLRVIVSVRITVADLLAIGTSCPSLWKVFENNSSDAAQPDPGSCRDLSLCLICLKVWFQGTRINWICLITKCSFGTKSIRI